MKKCLLAITLAISLCSGALSVPLLTGLLLGVGSALVNDQIAKKDQHAIAGGKHLYNIYMKREDGTMQYIASYDPQTNAPQAYFGLDLTFELIAVTNGPSPHDLTLYHNNAIVDFKKFHGGKVVGKGKIVDNAGPEGGNFMFDAEEIGEGMHYFTTRLSPTLYVSSQIQVMDHEGMLRLMQDQKVLQNMAGAGMSTNPVIPVYSVVMPDGTIKYFNSPDAAKVAIEALNTSARQPTERTETPVYREPERVQRTQDDESEPTNNNQSDESQAGMSIKALVYGQAGNRTDVWNRVLNQIDDVGADAEDLSELTIPVGKGIAIKVVMENPFQMRLIGSNGKTIGKVNAKDNGSGFEAVAGFYFKAGDCSNTLEVVSQGKVQKTLKFRRGK